MWLQERRHTQTGEELPSEISVEDWNERNLVVHDDYGKNDSSIDTKTDQDGKISVTSRYLLDALNVIATPKISINFNDKSKNLSVIESALVLKESNSEDYIHILMPVDDN